MNLIYILLSLFLTRTTTIPDDHGRVTIAVVYFNQVNPDLKRELNQNITSIYGCTVTEINDVIPASAFYAPRSRYRAPLLLDYLKTIKGYDKVLGVTSKDISTAKDKIYDWGIMGLGTCPGISCVISTFRIKTSNKALFNDRFIKVGLHEVGHTFGLPHCTFSNTCFMKDAAGTIKSVDRENRSLCIHCLKLLTSKIPND